MAQDARAGKLEAVTGLDALERPEPNAPGPVARFPGFDGLRAIAALAVFVAHSAGYLYYRRGPSFAPVLLQSWLARLGGFGVAVFFVLSGFLLYRPFVVGQFRSRPSPRVGPFWLRRFVRIFPAYWLVITVAVFVFGTLTARNFADYFTFYGLALNYRSRYALFGIGVEWTLVIELSFYLVLPGLAWALRALAWPDAAVRTQYRAQALGLLGVGVAATALRVWELWFFRPALSPIGTWFPPAQLDAWLVSYLDWFAAGMLLAVVSAWLAAGGRLPRFLAALAGRPWLSWLLAFECYGIVTRLRYPLYGYRVAAPIQEFLRLEMSLAAAVLLVIPAVFGNQDQGAIRGALRSRPLVWLGLISYGIYLWHVPIFDASTDWRGNGYFPSNPFAQVVVILVLTVMAATVSYLVVERPTRLWAQRLTRPKLSPVNVQLSGTSSPGASARVSVARSEPPDTDFPPPDREVLPLVVFGAIALGIAVIGLILPSLMPVGR